jgi:hypothetical protein
LSDSNGLRRHFRVADSRNVRRASPNAPLISLPCVLAFDEAEKPAKAKGFISQSETDGFIRPNRKRHPGPHETASRPCGPSSEKQ